MIFKKLGTAREAKVETAMARPSQPRSAADHV